MHVYVFVSFVFFLGVGTRFTFLSGPVPVLLGLRLVCRFVCYTACADVFVITAVKNYV